jgi:hypothetical protein
MAVWQIAIKKLNPAAVLSQSLLFMLLSFHFMLFYPFLSAKRFF